MADKIYIRMAPPEHFQSQDRRNNHVQLAEAPPGKFLEAAEQIGRLVEEKNVAYGDSFAKCGEFLRLLFPDGIKPDQYQDALGLVRVFDKQMRIATNRDAFGESPWKDIAGYAILGAVGSKK